jgi:hypothetical protein
MAQGQIGLRFNVDTSQAVTSFDGLTRAADDLNEKLKEAVETAKQTGDWNPVHDLSISLNNTLSARGSIMQQSKQANSQAQENMNKGGIFGGNSGSDFGKYILTQSLTRLTENVISALEKGFTAAKQRAGGDYAGAAVTERQQTGDLIGDAAGIAGGILGFIGGGPFGAALASSLSKNIVGFIANIGTHNLEKDLAYSAQYKKALPEIDTLNQLYGGAINRKSLEENNQHGLQMYSRAAAATEGTGLTTQAFIEAMKQMGGYGIRSETQALNMAQTQSLWSRFTGTDLSTIQKFAGQSYRYGGETGAVSTAYGGLMAQNMVKGQFSEFLNSMERILEEGIAKGFVRSSSEIAGNMALLYKLSGESKLWQGEQGAQRLSQMNMAISNATNLQSVEDVMTFGVVARDLLKGDEAERKANFERHAPGRHYTGTFYDEFQIMEGGLTPALLNGLFNETERLEGSESTAQIIGRFKNLFGVNNNTAVDIWDMYKNRRLDDDGNFVFEKDGKLELISDIITRMKENPKNLSDSERLQTAINKMTDSLVNIGSFKFERELELLEIQSRDVALIRGKLVGERDKDKVISMSEAAYLPEVDAAGRPTTSTITTLIDDKYFGGGFSSAMDQNLLRLSMAESQSKDYNNQILGARYNKEILPYLTSLRGDDISNEMIDLVYNLQNQHSKFISDGKIDSNEFEKLTVIMNMLIEALNRNTRSTEDNTDSDKDVTFEFGGS